MKLYQSLYLCALVPVALGAFALSGCGSSTAASTPGDPVAVVAAVQTAVKTAGKGMTISAALDEALSTKSAAHRPMLTSASCDATTKCNGGACGYPAVSVSGGNPGFSNLNDVNWPGQMTYCFLTVDSGDTVLGGFDLPTNVSCMINKFGVTYDGTAHNVTFTSAIISACNMTGSGLTDGMTAVITGSAPASFNTNFANGIIVDLSSTMGLTFKMALNVAGSKSSFLTQETWTGTASGLTSGSKLGAAAGAFDSSTGDLWYEKRDERLTCRDNGSCGFARHTRIHALLAMSGSTPTGLTNLSYAFSNTQVGGGDQGGYMGVVVQSSGALATGIKARLWEAWHGATQNSNPTVGTDMDTVANYIEYPNTHCYTNASDSASGCGTGPSLFSASTKFMLNSTDGHMAPAAWVAALTGQTFTSVNADSDTQF